MNPLVSILIPAHNAASSISETIESALLQTWPRKEIIIVDDGSADRTLEVAGKFGSKVVLASQPNAGAAAARNKAFSLSRGEYIQWLDADDLLAPEKIALQLSALDGSTNRTLLSSSWGHFMYRPNRSVFRPTRLWEDLSPLEWVLRKMEDSAYMQTSTWLVSRELTEIAGPWDTRLSADDDGEYFTRVVLTSERIKFVRDSKVYYRVSGSGSLSWLGQNNRKLESQFLSMRSQIEGLRAKGETDRVRLACLKYLQDFLIYFYPERTDIVGQAKELAESLGGRLTVPRLPLKYRWIGALFGWRFAKRSQSCYNERKLAMLKLLDKGLHCLTRAKAAV